VIVQIAAIAPALAVGRSEVSVLSALVIAIVRAPSVASMARAVLVAIGLASSARVPTVGARIALAPIGLLPIAVVPTAVPPIALVQSAAVVSSAPVLMGLAAVAVARSAAQGVPRGRAVSVLGLPSRSAASIASPCGAIAISRPLPARSLLMPPVVNRSASTPARPMI
jgi:hypothetical protein